MDASLINALVSMAPGLVAQSQGPPQAGADTDFAALLAAGGLAAEPADSGGKASALLKLLIRKNQIVGHPLLVDPQRLDASGQSVVTGLLEEILDKLEQLSPQVADLLGAMVARQVSADPELLAVWDQKAAEAVNALLEDPGAVQNVLAALGELEGLVETLSTLIEPAEQAAAEAVAGQLAPAEALQESASEFLESVAEISEPFRIALEVIQLEAGADSPGEKAGSLLDVFKEVLSRIRRALGQVSGRDRADVVASSVNSRPVEAVTAGEASPAVPAEEVQAALARNGSSGLPQPEPVAPSKPQMLAAGREPAPTGGGLSARAENEAPAGNQPQQSETLAKAKADFAQRRQAVFSVSLDGESAESQGEKIPEGAVAAGRPAAMDAAGAQAADLATASRGQLSAREPLVAEQLQGEGQQLAQGAQTIAETDPPAQSGGAARGVPGAGTFFEEIRARFDSALVAQRVMSAVRAARDGAPMRLSVRLEPPHLGTLRVNIVVRGTQVITHMVTESEGARSLILAHSPQLRADLEQAGYKLEGINVTVAGGFDGSAKQKDPGTGRRNASSSISFAAVLNGEGTRKDVFGLVAPGGGQLLNVVA